MDDIGFLFCTTYRDRNEKSNRKRCFIPLHDKSCNRYNVQSLKGMYLYQYPEVKIFQKVW